MLYLRNDTAAVQVLKDPVTGVERHIASGGLVQVTDRLADFILSTQPSIWVRVVAIALDPPKPKSPGELP